MMLAFLAFQLNKYLRFWVLATFSFFSIKFLEVNIANWKQSAIVIDKLTSNFERFNSGNIFILNTPDNFHGANVFRNFGLESPIAETIFVRGGKDMRAQVRDVLYYNMENIADSVKIAQVGKNSLKISFAQWGNWWWRHGIGPMGRDARFGDPMHLFVRICTSIGTPFRPKSVVCSDW